MKNETKKVCEQTRPAGKSRKRVYGFKNKLLTSLLLSIAAPLTVCFFGPLETYCGNIDEFTFALGDFFPYVILIALGMAALVFGLLMLLDGRAFDITSAVLLALAILTFAQKYYLNMGVNALAGDGVGEVEVALWAIILNTTIWVVVIGGAIALALVLKNQNKARFFVSTALVLMAVLVTQAIGCIAISADVLSPDRSALEGEKTENTTRVPSALTYENLNELSEGNNVVFFLIDRFDVRYFEALRKKEPELFDKLDGFTFYNDYTSLYCRTYPAVSSILTGKENSFEESRLNYFKEIYTDGGHLRNLYNAGYNVNVYTEKYYVYDDAYYMSDYVSNISGVKGYEIDSNLALSWDMLRLSLSNSLPFLAKDVVGYMSTPDFNSHAVYEADEPVYDADMKNVYDYITGNDFVTVEGKGQFSFIHIYGCHTPIKYNLNWEEANEKEKNDTTMALKQSLTIIYEYISEMKRLGVYDDATIVITGDHPAALSDTKLIGEASKSDNGTRVTAMLFKRAGESGTALATSTAHISQDELWATIYESEGLTSLKSGESFFDIPEGVDRERRYLFQLSVTREDKSRADEIVTYKIVGSARVKENWSIESRKEVGKIYK